MGGNAMAAKVANEGEYESITQITPAMAAEWLATKGRATNRTLRKQRVRGYVDLMRAGRWQTTSEAAISFGADGVLINGHHRLMAVVQFDEPVRFVVRRNVSLAVLPYLDAHQARSYGQVGRLLGVDTTLDPALRILFQVRRSQVTYVSAIHIETMRNRLAEQIATLRPFLPIQVASRRIPAGPLAGMLLIIKASPSSAPLFIERIKETAAHQRSDCTASRNVTRWVEARRGDKGPTVATDGARLIVNGFEQYLNGRIASNISTRPSENSTFASYMRRLDWSGIE
jgi:hypothetical protein